MNGPDDELAFDLAMSLRGTAVGRGRKVDDLMIVAHAVVRPMKMCRWRFERLPPEAAHGSHVYPRADDSGTT
jgi:hypothetical protein